MARLVRINLQQNNRYIIMKFNSAYLSKDGWAKIRFRGSEIEVRDLDEFINYLKDCQKAIRELSLDSSEEK